MHIPEELHQKYNVAVPRYTSYPPANFFHSNFSYTECEKQLLLSNEESIQNISFYLHIPFCSQLCFYCGCNTYISKNKKLIEEYVQAIKQEILIMKEFLSPDRKVSQIHWGGGTPNYLSATQIKDVMQVFYDHFSFIEEAEIAMECHPAHLTYSYIDELAQTGFNRISLGIQDFNELVLDAVNREKPAIPVEQLVDYIRSKHQISVNLDFIYGLPFQEKDNFSKTIEKALKIAPDRMVTFSYAHVPWVKKVQKKLEKYDLPNAQLKTTLFEKAYSVLTENGYIAIGLDHFAKSHDELSVAMKNKNLHRNFQGYSTRETTGQVYALGVSGISQLSNAYIQNTKDIKTYLQSVKQGKLAIENVYFLNFEEKVIREVIEELMCNLYLNWDNIAKNHQLEAEEVKSIVEYNKVNLDDFKKEQLLNYNNDEINVSQLGQYFIRNIASVFDVKLKGSQKQFSKSL